ncbi:MAG: helix-turn-helix domain-containing protein [Muribaculaceae bacterium]|nr:helix-turn-helix domain-containing protein [Muribaculaceae bacterium]
MNVGFKYNIDLPESLDEILEQDFWLIDNVQPAMFRSLTEPVKFAANTWIFVKSGTCDAEINLIPYHIDGPTFVLIRRSQFLMPRNISDDFVASVIVMSRRFEENLFLILADSPLYIAMTKYNVVSIPEEVSAKVPDFIANLNSILSDKPNPYGGEALVLETGSFLFRSLYKCYESFAEEAISGNDRITNRFMNMVQEHYKEERFLDYYASGLEITPKHLSRTIKKNTGYSAVEWIERFVILEAKVLLKSTNLNIQQIADELNFTSQSFFGKYFKKATGLSPKEYRNT